MVEVAALGLDAAEWTFVEDLLARGAMPNLAALRARSVVARLDNVKAYRSELPWTQFATGRDAETLGYWSTMAFDPARYRAAAVGALDARPFWEREGLRALVVDVPQTVVREDVDGVQVTGWGAHSPEYPRASSPRGLLTEIDARFGPHPAFANDCDLGWYSPEYLDNLTRALCDGARRRIDVVDWLTQRDHSFDFVLTTMSETHSAGHQMWHGISPTHPLGDHATAPLARERLVEVYRVVDECIGRFAELMDGATIVVFAAHGMQPNGNDIPSMVLLPELFHRAHFGRAALQDPDQTAWRRAGLPPVTPSTDEVWIGYMAQRFAASPRDVARNFVKRTLPRPVLDRARAALGRPRPSLGPLLTPIPPEDRSDPAALTLGVRDPDYQMAWRYHHRWPGMRWFALPTFSDGHVRINVRGRERDGVVAPRDYAAACDDVVEMVAACRDPRTGESVLADAARMRDDPMDDGPGADLVLWWAGAPDAFDHPTIGTIGPFPYGRTGEHSPNGFAFVAGPGIAPGDAGRRSAFDLTPTVLSLLGETPDDDMAGAPLPTAVTA